jgi:N-methylhydantoinase A
MLILMNYPSSQTVLGIDIGGTFTDFVAVENGLIRINKRLTTSADPSISLLAGIEEMNTQHTADIVHGSTIATNALLERRGARTALVTTRGFADVIEIGRQDRPDLYALEPVKPVPLIPPGLRFEVDERVDASGNVLVPLSAASLTELVEAIRHASVESVAVCLLFSFLYPDHERMIGAALREFCSVSLSCELLPEYREYERTSTTAINAYVTPIMDRYLQRLETGLPGRRLRIMQSNGGVITASTARREAARTVLSGPAGGAVGAFTVAKLAGFDHVISFDMGGTSADVALFPGEIARTRESQIGGMPLRVPVVDMQTVGAGGGSIARVDAGGALRVGPESAGADPGPACYGRGDLPTTSDANLVLGRLHPAYFLGGQMTLHSDRAADALSRLVSAMGVSSAEEVALGVVQVANATMQRAIRAVSVERGYDPRDFVLVPFGGAGPLHACALAESLSMRRILIPRTPGVLSAFGMVLADLVKDYSQSVLTQQLVLNPAVVDTIFAPLEASGLSDLAAEGIAAEHIVLERSFDMRYLGQSHEITVSQPADGDWHGAFHAAHAQRFGHHHDAEPVEIVNARLKATGIVPKPEIALLAPGDETSPTPMDEGPVWFSADGPTQSVYFDRDALEAGHQISGPAIIFQFDTTTVIAPGWSASVDRRGNLVLSL